jgi:hypothetical protein
MPQVIVTAPAESAKEADLRYVSDAGPGILRKRRDKGFTYVDVNGETIRNPGSWRVSNLGDTSVSISESTREKRPLAPRTRTGQRRRELLATMADIL